MKRILQAILLLSIFLVHAPHAAADQAVGQSGDSWEALHAKLAERRTLVQKAADSTAIPQYSEFKGKYINSNDTRIYKSFIKLNPKTGLLERDGRTVRPFFTVYSQPGPNTDLTYSIPNFDYDLLEKDFIRMKQAGINPQVRHWSWSDFLNYDGTWKKLGKQPKGHRLPYFEYAYQLYDYFLDRVQAHGLYVNIEPSLYEGLNAEVVPDSYRGKILLYDELWGATSEAYAKILGYYSKREVIVAVTVGEGDLTFDYCKSEPRMCAEYQRYIRKKYGSVSNLQREWPQSQAARELTSFETMSLPDSNNQAGWIDLRSMRQQIILSRINDLAGVFRTADPNHVLCYRGPDDFASSTNGLECFDRASLRWDVIGANTLEYSADSNIDSYRPYIDALGAYPNGFTCSAWMAQQNDASWLISDIAGGGSAFIQCNDWQFLSGRNPDKPTEYDETALNSLDGFLTSIDSLSFSRKSDAKVLILRNQYAALGASAGYDFGNTRCLSEILTQLHIPFDILPDSDVALGDFEQGKVNLNRYQFIFIPAQYQLLVSRTWQILDDWISDPRYVGKRGLCFGMFQPQDCYFNQKQPTEVHPAFKRLTGISGFAREMSVSGQVKFNYSRNFGDKAKGDELALDFPNDAKIGTFDDSSSVERVLDLNNNGPTVVVRNIVNINPVYTCGFYLGMTYDPIHGKAQKQNPYDKLNNLYLGMLKSAGVEPDISAPNNVRVYIADGVSGILVKELVGEPTDVTLSFKSLPYTVFDRATAVYNSDGSALIKDFRVGPHDTAVLRKVAGISVSGVPGVSLTCRATQKGGFDFELSGKGEINLSFELQPKMIYSVLENGDLVKVFTSDAKGRQSMAFDLGDGSKPLRVTLKPNKR